MDRLAVTAETLREFRNQPLSEHINTWKKENHHNKRVVKRREVHGVSGVLEIWPDDEQHSVRFPVLTYIRSGQADLKIADYIVQCPQDHFLLIRPGDAFPSGDETHLEEPREGRHCEVWHFISTGLNRYVALFVHISQEEKGFNNGHYYIVGDSRVSQLFHFFTEEVCEKAQQDRETAHLLLHTFLRLFLREIKENRFHDRGPAISGVSSTASTSSPIEIAQQYIAKNLNHHLTIDIVARAVFMSRSEFTGKFRKETGQTFHQYLTTCRLEEAKHWLMRKDCSIEVVCQFVGLKNTRFHQLFLQHTGMTPQEFRQKNKIVQ